MGSEHLPSTLTPKEAASHLGVSVRTIYNWVQRKLLHRDDEGKIPVYELDLVEEARHEADSLDTKYELVNLRYRMEKLERQTALLMTLHETDRSPVRPQAASAESLVAGAELLLKNPNIKDPNEFQSWARLFTLMDKVTFELCGEHSWDVFYRLCLELMKRVASHPDFDSDLDTQLLHAHLNHGRVNLRTEVLLHLAQSGKLPLEEHRKGYSTISTPKADLLSALTAN